MKDWLSQEERHAVQLRIKKILKEIRTVNNLSQFELSKVLDLHPSTVNQMESGARLPTYEFVLIICDKLNITPNYLFGFCDETYDTEIARRIEKLNAKNKKILIDMLDALAEKEG